MITNLYKVVTFNIIITTEFIGNKNRLHERGPPPSFIDVSPQLKNNFTNEKEIHRMLFSYSLNRTFMKYPQEKS